MTPTNKDHAGMSIDESKVREKADEAAKATVPIDSPTYTAEKWFIARDAAIHALNALGAYPPAQAGASTLPDIGPDPFKGTSEEYTLAKAEKRLRDAFTVQQKGIPDQTALVWRCDLLKLFYELPRLRSIEEDWRETRAAPPTTPAVESGEAFVMQVDREAAARYYEATSRGQDQRAENARRGLIDDLPTVQAFARHRSDFSRPAVESESADRGVDVERVAKIICRAAGKEPDELVPGSYRPSGYPNFFEDGGVAGDMAHYQWREYTTAALAAIDGETT